MVEPNPGVNSGLPVLRKQVTPIYYKMANDIYPKDHFLL